MFVWVDLRNVRLRRREVVWVGLSVWMCYRIYNLVEGVGLRAKVWIALLLIHLRLRRVSLGVVSVSLYLPIHL
jgi:hypothetical protein